MEEGHEEGPERLKSSRKPLMEEEWTERVGGMLVQDQQDGAVHCLMVEQEMIKK